MPITFSCSHCHKAYRVDDHHAGKATKCRICQTEMTVPSPNVPPPETQPLTGGATLYRHKMPTSPPPLTFEATPFLNQITNHIKTTIGPTPMVFHEMMSTGVHLDLHPVPPTDEGSSPLHPFGTSHFTYVTSGLSSKPMNTPPGSKMPRFMELMIALPADWPGLKPDGSFEKDTMKDERNWWPIRWIKNVARIPSLLNTFLWLGHTIPNGEEAAPFAENTRLGCMMVGPPLLSPKSLKLVINDQVIIWFLALMPLYPEEMEFKLKNGTEALDKLLDAAKLNELIQPDRPNVVLR